MSPRGVRLHDRGFPPLHVFMGFKEFENPKGDDMTKKKAVLGCAVAAVLVGTAAWAGSKYAYPVFIDLTQKKAYGTLGAARNSSDATQFISCDVHAYSDGSKNMS